jgi:hypothetical protein
LKQDVLTFDDDLVLNSVVVKPRATKNLYTEAVDGQIICDSLIVGEDNIIDLISTASGGGSVTQDDLDTKQDILGIASNITVRSLKATTSSFGSALLDGGQISCDSLIVDGNNIIDLISSGGSSSLTEASFSFPQSLDLGIAQYTHFNGYIWYKLVPTSTDFVQSIVTHSNGNFKVTKNGVYEVSVELGCYDKYNDKGLNWRLQIWGGAFENYAHTHTGGEGAFSAFSTLFTKKLMTLTTSSTVYFNLQQSRFNSHYYALGEVGQPDFYHTMTGTYLERNSRISFRLIYAT